MSYKQLKLYETVLFNGKKFSVSLHTHVLRFFMLKKRLIVLQWQNECCEAIAFSVVMFRRNRKRPKD